jgi:head-tail adaptor
MAARRHLIHPKLLRNLADFYPQTGTVQRLNAAQDTYGQPVEAWQLISSRLINIPCRVSPGGGSPGAVSEIKTAEQTYGRVTHRIALRGAYPEIDERMRFVSDGQAYDIQGVQTDPQTRSTYLDTEIVRGEPDTVTLASIPTLATDGDTIIVTDGGVGLWVV